MKRQNNKNYLTNCIIVPKGTSGCKVGVNAASGVSLGDSAGGELATVGGGTDVEAVGAVASVNFNMQNYQIC